MDLYTPTQVMLIQACNVWDMGEREKLTVWWCCHVDISCVYK